MSYIDRPLLIHVAAENENRGRVVLAAQTGTPHPVAVEASLTIARTFQTRLECLLVTRSDVVALADHAFAREISHHGRVQALRVPRVEGQQSAETATARRTIETAANRAGVAVIATVVHADIMAALTQACTVQGPWNIMALAEPMRPADVQWVSQLMGEVSGATGLVCIGPQAVPGSRSHVVIVVEDLDRLTQKLRVAERLALQQSEATAAQITVLMAAASAEQADAVEAHSRLLIPTGKTEGGVTVAFKSGAIRYGLPVEVAEAVRLLDGGWLIARAGGIAVPADGEAAALLSILRCPLLLVR